LWDYFEYRSDAIQHELLSTRSSGNAALRAFWIAIRDLTVSEQSLQPLISEDSAMNVVLKNSPSTSKQRVSDRTMTVGLAALASIGVMALPLRADAQRGHPDPTRGEISELNASDAHTQLGSDSLGAEKNEDTPTCRSIPTDSVTTTDAPQINILAPTLDRPLVSPLDIEVQFVPAITDAAVQADTFRV
jgi:hypothetical protein